MRLGVISNLRSQQNLRHLERFRAVMARAPEIPYAELDGVGGLKDVLTDFASRGVDHLVLNSGDGTVIASLTQMFHEEIFERQPIIVVLPGGMTNMIAKDAGYSGRPDRGMKKLLAALDSDEKIGKTVERSILSMRLTPKAAPIYGMFIGTAAIYRAIIFTRKEIHSTGLEANGAAAMTLVSFFFKRLFGRLKNDPGVRQSALLGWWRGRSAALYTDIAPCSPFAFECIKDPLRLTESQAQARSRLFQP